MRVASVTLISALAFASPLAAQTNQPNQNSGVGGVIQNLDRAMNPDNPSTNRQQDRNDQYNQNTTDPRDQRGSSRSLSGSSNMGPEDQRIRNIQSQSDYNNEKQRLDTLQRQVNDAQQQLDREYQELNQAQRNIR